MNDHHCFVHKHRDTDWHFGDGNIKFKGISSGAWGSYIHYFERQDFSFDSEGCIIFMQQEATDDYIDYLIQAGQIGTNLLELFNKFGFMDSVNSLDGCAHFHSSMLYTFRNTGNGFNGNSLADPWDAIRKFGIIPWTALPFDQNTTQADCLAKNPQNLLDMGQQFLAAVGGKNWVNYHYVNDGGPTNTQAMDIARQQAPLCLGVLAEAPGWNQYEPPIVQGPPCHGVMNYDKNDIGELILDHYVPFEKVLQTGYPMQYVLQAIINIVPPPPAPLPPASSFPADPTTVQVNQWQVWLTALAAWLNNIKTTIMNGIKGRHG
jgi:hypothetical protein